MRTKLIDAATAGERIGRSARWLLEEARNDRVPHVRLGRYVRFDPDVLDAWIDAQHRGPVVEDRSAA